MATVTRLSHIFAGWFPSAKDCTLVINKGISQICKYSFPFVRFSHVNLSCQSTETHSLLVKGSCTQNIMCPCKNLKSTILSRLPEDLLVSR